MSLLALAAVVLWHVDTVAGAAWLPACLFHQLSGLHCPGCGATRALHALVHWQFLQALKCNALLMGLMVALPAWVVAGRRLSMRTQVQLAWATAVVFVAFFILRNLGLGAVLAPGQ